jgi:hypothetical protein
MFEIENDSDWSQYTLADSDIIGIIYLGVPPGVDLYVRLLLLGTTGHIVVQSKFPNFRLLI